MRLVLVFSVPKSKVRRAPTSRAGKWAKDAEARNVGGSSRFPLLKLGREGSRVAGKYAAGGSSAYRDIDSFMMSCLFKSARTTIALLRRL